MYLSARPRSAAVMLVPEVAAVFAALAFSRATLVRCDKSLLRFSRFSREFEEMDRFFVLTSNISRL